MAVNVFEQAGVKEVANVQFIALAADTAHGVNAGDVVLYLDSLKVSTIEQTAEQTDATGGWGNPKLITWDYGKEVTVTLEDALISMESLAFMYGGAIKKSEDATTPVTIRRSAVGNVVKTSGSSAEVSFTSLYDGASKATITASYAAGLGKFAKTSFQYINFTKGVRGAATVSSIENIVTLANIGTALSASGVIDDFDNGDEVRVFWDEIRSSTDSVSAVSVNISADTFPGTYKVVGDTFIRSAETLQDSAFQFVINKAKVSSEITLTLEAEGDPATFEMKLTVLRDEDNDLFKLIKY